ncbi:putative glucomannan 4-beta-mannosyltransferase [Helianthus anomalus]
MSNTKPETIETDRKPVLFVKVYLNKEYVSDSKFVVIFDADFQPDEEFLWRTVPYLLGNPELALVQARWKFGNASC